MYNIFEYNFSYMCRRDVSDKGQQFLWSWFPRSKSHLCSATMSHRSTRYYLWVSISKVSEKRESQEFKLDFSFSFCFLSQIYLQMFTMGEQVLLFMSFLVYRGASHTDTHSCTYTQAAEGHSPLIRGFDWFKPTCDQQSSLPKCPWARHYLYHPRTLISDPTYEGTVECF